MTSVDASAAAGRIRKMGESATIRSGRSPVAQPFALGDGSEATERGRCSGQGGRARATHRCPRSGTRGPSPPQRAGKLIWFTTRLLLGTSCAPMGAQPWKWCVARGAAYPWEKAGCVCFAAGSQPQPGQGRRLLGVEWLARASWEYRQSEPPRPRVSAAYVCRF
jgi:hypothetical protein